MSWQYPMFFGMAVAIAAAEADHKEPTAAVVFACFAALVGLIWIVTVIQDETRP